MSEPLEGEDLNVRVAVRCRPFNGRETKAESAKCLAFDGSTVHIVHPKTNEKKSFVFDFSYDWDTTQERVYADLGAPILDKAFKGYNGTIFAYGQTGSGKSFSMMGGDTDRGIIPKMNDGMFEYMNANETENLKFFVTVSYLEIYQEVVHDLLNPSGQDLKIREHPQLGVYVDKLAEMVVKSAKDVDRYITQGAKVRQVAETKMNATSSRSHSVFTIKLEQQRTDEDTQTTRRAKINLVDLAGSERADSTGATGERLKEGAAINKSLSALGNVINALADPQKSKGHIPYRDSKLTRILQESLGGNSITVMLTALSPADINYDETLSTLNYANRAKNIKNKSKVNEDEHARVVRGLREEIDRLRAMLAGGAATGTPQDMARMEEMAKRMEDLQMAKQQTWQEKERLSKLYEEERRRNLQERGLTQWVMESLRTESSATKDQLDKLQKDKEDMIREYRQHKDFVDSARKTLETEMTDYKRMQTEAGTDEPTPESRVKLQKIHQMKKQLKESSERLKKLKDLLRQNQEATKRLKDDMRTQQLLLDGNSEFRKAIQEDERNKLKAENEAMLAQERQRLREEMDKEREALLAEADRNSASAANSQDMMNVQMELLKEQAQKKMLVKQVELLERQIEKLNQDFDANELSAAAELEQQELHFFSVFRQYREHFETQRKRVEAQYMKQLEQAIQDAVYLASRNNELEQNLDELRRRLKTQ
eukprot:TRINITY_DN6417_c0_g1_i1.p1 TRINITY_DN6417_c0_g1~~TRINITY_DN6417_c0_g1_i1.p1  ORF type:complete len:712 (+),score=193.81 TRINITY_DN6417_c0_g1_i1:32-2167(+)